MKTYYVGNMLVSDELYHHGIKGQKWGIRRYQNPDGSLTAEGRRRFAGQSLGKYAKDSNSILRKLATGDHILGVKRYYDRKEQRLSNKIANRTKNGKNVSDRLIRKYNAIKANNIMRDVNNSHVSTGKLLVQNLLMGHYADYYRESRSQGYGRIKSANRAESMRMADELRRQRREQRRKERQNRRNG